MSLGSHFDGFGFKRYPDILKLALGEDTKGFALTIACRRPVVKPQGAWYPQDYQGGLLGCGV